MKKIIMILAIALIGCQLTGYTQVRVGIAAGATVASMENTVDGNTKDPNSLRGYVVGLVLDAPFCKTFSYQPSLSYTQKGATVPEPTLLLDKTQIGLRYIEFNNDILYNVRSSKGGAFYIGAGPSISFSVPSKKVEISKNSDIPDNTTSIHFGKESGNDLRGFDYGANFAAGYRMPKGFFVNINYNLGLRNLATDGQTGKLKNRYFGIRLGYFLENGNKK